MIALLLGACAPAEEPEEAPAFPPLPPFVGEQTATEPFVGVQLVSRTQTEPRPLSSFVVRVDPAAPGVSFTGTPENGAAELETARQTGTEFLASSGAAVAINAHFFAPWPALPDDPADLLGLAITDGEQVSPFDEGALAAFVLDAEGRPAVVRAAGGPGSYETDPPVAIDDAVGAYEVILEGGVNTATWEELHPRTAIGHTADGLVVLFVVDGRQDGISEGMTTPEVAEAMATFGVTDALNLDGGGSTTLVIRGSAGPEVVNVPVGYDIPDTQRHNGSFFGVRAD
jgi:hypothetical protein